MDYMKDGDRFLIRLDKGDDLVEKLNEFACAEKVTSGQISGIGALEDVELGFYDLSKKEYQKKTFEGDFELLSLEGNLTHLEGKPFFHMHVALSDQDFRAFGGHLYHAKVAVTCELNFRAFDELVERRLDPEIGLHTLSFRRV